MTRPSCTSTHSRAPDILNAISPKRDECGEILKHFARSFVCLKIFVLVLFIFALCKLHDTWSGNGVLQF